MSDVQVQILRGEALSVLGTLPDASVHCCVTSPPYFGLRSYLPTGHPDKDKELGLEPTPAAYVARLVEVFRAVKRVLRPDATLWLNLGDSFCSTAPGTRNAPMTKGSKTDAAQWANMRPATPPGLKPKDCIGIPWMVAFALRDDGWYLRSDIIWHKPNCMPESVTDRPTKAHEYLFLLAKSPTYYYDYAGVMEPATPDRTRTHTWADRKARGEAMRRGDPASSGPQRTSGGVGAAATTRNRRSVWSIATKPFSAKRYGITDMDHFAVMPEALVEPCIQAGTSDYGCCAECGAPYRRMVERTREADPTAGHNAMRGAGHFRDDPGGPANRDGRVFERVVSSVTTGWQPTCTCVASVVPCTVLDPFAGSGTVGRVAIRHHRTAILIELNADYCRQIEQRISGVQMTLGLEAVG